uniref:KIB1-4 beta-propeller domain-containing protein n=1 Tax=Oryza barthii TaxID=65489 RepID=A0A0D3HNL8_9ORYZ
MQAVALDVLLIFPDLLVQSFAPSTGGGIGFELFQIYGGGACLLGKTPRLPIVADAAERQIANSQVQFPGRRVVPDEQPLERGLLPGSAHGWLVTADEQSNLHLVNPLTGAQVALPPVTALHHVESLVDEEGNLVYSVDESLGPDDPEANLPEFEELADREVPVEYPAEKLRLFMYHRVILSCSPSAGRECVALLVHRPDGMISFARPGDERWTHINRTTSNGSLKWDTGYTDALYNKNDGLFYLLSFDGSICALDLSGSSPVARNIVKKNTQWDNPSKYIVLAPWGDLLEVWRLRDFDEPDETPECSSVEFEDRSDKWLTEEIMLYIVDIDKQKLVKISSIGDHALFLGFNSVVCLPTNKFPMLKPDCAYLSDKFYEEICVKRHNWREIGIWDLKSCKLQSLGDVESLHAWRNWPSPIWITPSLN